MEDHFSQIGPIKKASLIIPKNTNTDEEQDPSTPPNKQASSYGFVKYTCESDASTAAKQLNRSTLTMQTEEGETKSFHVMVESASLQMKKQQQQQQQSSSSKDDTTTTTAPTTTTWTEQQKKHNRVILRNLSFYAKESHVQQAMEAFGKVVEVHIPTVKGKSRGFAFCTFSNSQQAQAAIHSNNGKIMIKQRAASVEFSVPKRVHQQQKEEAEKQQRKQDYRQRVQEDLKKQNEREKRDNNHEEEEEDSDSDSNSSNSNSEGEDGSDSDSDSESGSDSEEGSDGEDDSEEEEDDDEDEEKNNLQLAVEEQRQLFIRNMPFDATRHDVFEAFRTYGKIQAIYIVTDPATKLPRGTAFVTYEKDTGAARCMRKAGNNSGGGGQQQASLVLKGRPLLIDYAVDKETANTLKKDTNLVAQKQTKDKRNIYLKTEGRIDQDEVWAQISESDKLKRQKAWSDKHTKLKSPLFFINPLRLSIRNISKGVDEGALKKLLFQATERGLEKGLVSVNDMVVAWQATGEQTNREILERSKEYHAKGSIPDNENPTKVASLDERNIKRTIPSVYLDRDFEAAAKRGDKNSAPSRGFAFAEFTHHVQALACLRELNNNAAYSEEFAAGGKASATAASQKKKSKKKKNKPGNEEDSQVGRSPRLIVEFTVENKAKAKQQNERRAHQQAHRQKQKLETKEKRELAASRTEQKEEKSSKRGRGAKQREKKRQRRLEKEEGGTTSTRDAEAKPRTILKKRSRDGDGEEERKAKKGVKPPKKLNKRQRDDRDSEEKFSNLVDKYKVAFQDAIGDKKEKKETAATANPRKEALEEGKRWFE